jgi:heme exporter protein C
VHSIAAESIRVVDDQLLYAIFSVPAAMPYKQQSYQTTLIVDNPQNGTAIMPNAVFIRPGTDSISAEGWLQAPVADLHAVPYINIPYRNILTETIRNTYFHVPFWFAMIVLFGASVFYAIKYLQRGLNDSDMAAQAFALVGTVFGILGLATGAVWAKNTWGAYWSFDVKQNMSLIAVLIYCAYFVLRGSFDDAQQRARISAVYNIFAFATLIPLLFIIPRIQDSLHPGNGGNPAFGSQDLDNTMRMVFYPAVIAMILLGVWVAQLWYRYYRLRHRIENTD